MYWLMDQPMKCTKCEWEGKLGECEPDIDGDGSLGCPECNEIAHEKGKLDKIKSF